MRSSDRSPLDQPCRHGSQVELSDVRVEPELTPQDVKIEVDRLTGDEAVALGRYLAGSVGRAHGRLMEASTREARRADLVPAGTATVVGPPRLWSRVVELLGIHESAHPDHCRRLARGIAA